MTPALVPDGDDEHQGEPEQDQHPDDSRPTERLHDGAGDAPPPQQDRLPSTRSASGCGLVVGRRGRRDRSAS